MSTKQSPNRRLWPSRRRFTEAVRPDRRARGAWFVIVGAVLVALGAAAAAAASSNSIPQPAPGSWTATSLALLQHGHQRCASLGERVTTYWSGLDGAPEERRLSIDHYLLLRGTEDLAAARESLDLARRFLAGVGRENNAEIGDFVARLHAAEGAFCDELNQPASELVEFRRDFAAAARSVSRLEAQLATLVPLPPRQDLREALTPYTRLIEGAGAAAAEQVRQQLAAQEPSPQVPTLYEVMVDWHRRYQASAQPTKTALRLYLEGRSRNDSTTIQQACKSIMENVLPLLADRELFQAPDPHVEAPLRRAYGAIRSCAVHCLAGHFREADAELRRMNESLIKVTQVLGRYSLHP